MLNYRILEISQVSRDLSRKSKKKKGPKTPIFLVDPSDPCTHVIRQDELEKVIDCCSVIFDILYVNGLTRPSPHCSKEYNLKLSKAKDKLINLWISYVGRAGVDSWKNLFKYKITAFFSQAFQQDIPPPPKDLDNDLLLNPKCIVVGFPYRWLWSQKVKNPTLYKDIALSYLQSKKGAPPVSEDSILSARETTWLQLTSEPEKVPTYAVTRTGVLDWERRVVPPTFVKLEPSIFGEDCEVLRLRDLQKGVDWETGEPREFKDFSILDKEWVKGQLRRTVNEIFGRKSLKVDDIYKPFFPSTSANYYYGRNEMGAVSALYDVYDGFGNKSPGIDIVLGTGKLNSRLPEEYGAKGIQEAEEIAQFEMGYGSEVKNTLAVLFDDSVLQENWRQAYDKLFELALEEEPLTKTVGLPEPLKVRVITCGPPITYTVLKPLQKILWRTLKKWDVFRLIGEPISADFMMKRIGRLEENEEYLSGDYKASTDYLHSWVSECLNQAIFENYKWNNRELSLVFLNQLEKLTERALTHHLIEDPEDPTIKKEQKEGQLMGSIVSFPFLCLANAALCRASLEIANGKTYTLSEAPLACNGDDCILRGLKGRIRPIWEHVCSLGGLHSSVGKTYFSSEFMVMNSVHFDYDGRAETDFLVERKFVNMGLVYGKSKSGVAGKSLHQLGTINRALKRTCPPESFSRANELFIKSHRQVLENCGLPWFLPEWLGGLGLVCDGERRKKKAKWDLVLAGSIRRSIGDPLAPHKEKPQNFKGMEEWLMHKLVMTEFRDNWAFTGPASFVNIEVEGTERTLESQWTDFYTSSVVDLLFTKKCEYPLIHDGLKDLGYGPYKESPVHKDRMIAGLEMFEMNERNLRHNQIVMKIHDARLRSDLNGYPFIKGNYPESFEEIAFEKRESYYPLFNIRN